MKYMLMMFGDQASMMETRSMDWVHEMIAFMHTLNSELAASGKLVVAEGLADASEAKTVRLAGGAPIATDGPFAESKESLAGFWIVNVDSEIEALELTERIVAFTGGAMEVRRVGDENDVL